MRGRKAATSPREMNLNQLWKQKLSYFRLHAVVAMLFLSVAGHFSKLFGHCDKSIAAFHLNWEVQIPKMAAPKSTVKSCNITVS